MASSKAIPPTGEFLRGFRQYISQPVTASFIAGGISGAVSRTVVSPLERLKILFQVQGPGNTTYQGVGPALAKMWRDEGWRGFMRWVELVHFPAPPGASRAWMIVEIWVEAGL